MVLLWLTFCPNVERTTEDRAASIPCRARGNHTVKTCLSTQCPDHHLKYDLYVGK